MDYSKFIQKMPQKPKTFKQLAFISTALEFNKDQHTNAKECIAAFEEHKQILGVLPDFKPKKSDVISEQDDVLVLLLGKLYDNPLETIKIKVAPGIEHVFMVYLFNRK
jgi:hypothetical protein